MILRCYFNLPNNCVIVIIYKILNIMERIQEYWKHLDLYDRNSV